jgi:hypothetical protein
VLSVGGFVPLSQAFRARLALRDVGFSRADATAMTARRVAQRMSRATMLFDNFVC